MTRRAVLLLAILLGGVTGWAVARWSRLPVVSGPGRLASATVGPGSGSTPARFELLPDAPVRNVILVFGDGLGLAQTAAARIHLLGPGGRLEIERFPVTGLVATHPANGLVTKSDAGATAYAAGVKTVNGRVGVAPDGRRLASLFEWAREEGWRTGLVTSSYFFDATPASFVAHVERRHDHDAIIEQMAAAGVDLIAGGGLERLRPRSDGRDLVAEAEARGVHVVTDRSALAHADALPLWAVFPGRDLGERPDDPTLGELASRSIDLLSAASRRGGRGFLLLVEEEAIDSASHFSDLERLADAVARLDAAAAAAAEFARRDGSTLVLVLADHSTGGLTIRQSSTAERLDLMWSGDEHAGEPIVLWAYGPRDAALRFTGLLDNTEVHDRLVGLLEESLAPAGGAAPAPDGG
ncbi:MAG TPA: alkaline phosphatase [Thermoanaerobaculia bacterium]|nr:alkaline phosphatase [Thermoanaerobaculia bacterium]